MKYLVLLSMLIIPSFCSAGIPLYQDSLFGVEWNIGYMNINCNALNSYFGKYNYAPLSGDNVLGGESISFGNEKNRIRFGVQLSSSIYDSDQLPAKFMKIENVYLYFDEEYTLLKRGRFSLPVTFGLSAAITTLSLITDSHIPVSAAQAGSWEPGSTVLQCNTYYIPIGLKPTFTLYKKPKWIFYQMNISLDLKYYLAISSSYSSSNWTNQEGNILSGMPLNKFNSYYIGIFDLEWFIKKKKI